MSIFERALAGLGTGAAQLASKYIDEDLLQQRAQFMADLQIQNAKRMEDYTQSDEVQGRRRANRAADIESEGSASLKGEIAKATNPVLRQAIADRARVVTTATGEAQTGVEAGRMKALTPLEAQRAGAIADAQGRAQARWREQPKGVADKLADVEAVLGRPLNEPEKLALLGLKGSEKEDPVKKMAREAVSKQVENGLIKPEEAGPAADKIERSFAAVRQAAQLGERIRQARSEGKVGEALSELRTSGASDAQLLGLGFTKDEIKQQPKPAAPRVGATAAPSAASQPAPAGSPQAKWDARQEASRQASLDERARIQHEFDQAAAALSPEELVRRYPDAVARRGLDTSRLTRLKDAESRLLRG